MVRRKIALLSLTTLMAVAGVGGFQVSAAQKALAAAQYCADIMPIAQRPTLRYGDDGWCVQELQARLNARGARLSIDHSFGPATLAATKAFQTRTGLLPTGVVDQVTWLHLVGSSLAVPPYTSASQYIAYRGPNHTAKIVLSFDDCPESFAAFTGFVNAAKSLGVTTVLAPTGRCQAGPTAES